MSQLEMGAGNSKLKMGIAGGLVAVFGVVAYSVMHSSSDAPASKASAAQTAAAPAPAAPASPQATETAGGTAPAEVASAAQAPAEPAAASANAAPAETPAPQPATIAASKQPVELAMAETSAAPSAATRNDASPMSMDDLTANDSPADEAPAAAAPKAVRIRHNKPVAPPRPPASALREWWKTDSSTPYAVDFIGQAEGSNALVVLFANPVDPSKAGEHVRVLAPDGKPVALNWQRGNSPRVLVHNDLPAGRYTVVLDAGSKLSGPVFIQ